MTIKLSDVRRAVKAMRKREIKQKFLHMRIINEPLFKKLKKEGRIKEISPGVWDLV